MAPTEARPSKAAVADRLADLSIAAGEHADQHCTAAQGLLQLAHGFSHGDHSGSTEAHTAAIGLALAAQTEATMALADEVRALRMALVGALL
jgi:hypothetical protein